MSDAAGRRRASLRPEHLSRGNTRGPLSEVGGGVAGVIGRGDDVTVTREMRTKEGRLPPVPTARVAVEHKWMSRATTLRVPDFKGKVSAVSVPIESESAACADRKRTGTERIKSLRQAAPAS
jgi:hypothetical protein